MRVCRIFEKLCLLSFSYQSPDTQSNYGYFFIFSLFNFQGPVRFPSEERALHFITFPRFCQALFSSLFQEAFLTSFRFRGFLSVFSVSLDGLTIIPHLPPLVNGFFRSFFKKFDFFLFCGKSGIFPHVIPVFHVHFPHCGIFRPIYRGHIPLNNPPTGHFSHRMKDFTFYPRLYLWGIPLSILLTGSLYYIIKEGLVTSTFFQNEDPFCPQARHSPTI